MAVLDDAASAAALLKPPRLEILGALRDAPDSAAGLARRLGVPRQRLGYHLGELEKHGLVELVEERRKGNCVERVLSPRSRYLVVSPEVLGDLAAVRPEALRDRLSWSYLVALASRALRDLVRLRRGADRAGKRLPTLAIESTVRVGSPRALHAFAEDLTQSVAEVVARHHDDEPAEGRELSLFLGAYPTPRNDGLADLSAEEDPE
ncbi:MAG: winged helix-turn-helix domain-containing protein [Acidobacteriota bacterium]